MEYSVWLHVHMPRLSLQLLRHGASWLLLSDVLPTCPSPFPSCSPAAFLSLVYPLREGRKDWLWHSFNPSPSHWLPLPSFNLAWLQSDAEDDDESDGSDDYQNDGGDADGWYADDGDNDSDWLLLLLFHCFCEVLERLYSKCVHIYNVIHTHAYIQTCFDCSYQLTSAVKEILQTKVSRLICVPEWWCRWW